MTQHTAGRTLDWTGTERRTGGERRVAVMARADERRVAERRGGTGERGRSDPIAALFEDLDRGSMLGGREGSGAKPSTVETIGTRLRPQHRVHGAVESLAAIGGHPIHPILVPLPIGSFVGALAADVAFAATRDPFFARAGRLLTATGMITGAAAGLAGAVDFVGRGDVRSHTTAWFHGGGNVAMLAISGASLAVRLGMRDDRRAAPAGLALSAAAAAILLVTGWLGGELAYRNRIGVMREGADA